MILSKARRYSLLAGLLCLLLVAFTGASYGQGVQWDVLPSPTEVINTGRSEVLGSITLVVRQPGVTVDSQIGILYNQRMMIDNAPLTGITIFAPAFATTPNVDVANIDVTGTGLFAGQISINITGGEVVAVGDIIRIDGVRGRIDKSDLITAGTDAFAQLQSIDNPSANQFFPETVRVAKSFNPMVVEVLSETATLCLPPFGSPSGAPLGEQMIIVTEGFHRAFVDNDANNDGISSNDRLDTNGNLLGDPTQATRVRIALNSIPAGVTGISWPATVTSDTCTVVVPPAVPACTTFTRITSTGFTSFDSTAGTAFATYNYNSPDQTAISDRHIESFEFQPALLLSTNQAGFGIQTGTVRAGVTLYPGPASDEPSSGLYQPFAVNSSSNEAGEGDDGPAMPRFQTLYVSNDGVSSPDRNGTTAKTQFGIYALFSPCVCYLMYPYTTLDGFWDTGLVVANTSDDSGVLTTDVGAGKQSGTVTFWLYDYRLGNVTPAAGVFLPDPTHAPPLGVTGPGLTPAPASQPIYYAGQSAVGLLSQLVAGPVATTLATKGFTDFRGYVIAKANFQFCHGFAFISDKGFATIAQGYTANVIPDPAVTGHRIASSAGGSVAFGESLNN